jgi:hypothetical protein
LLWAWSRGSGEEAIQFKSSNLIADIVLVGIAVDILLSFNPSPAAHMAAHYAPLPAATSSIMNLLIYMAGCSDGTCFIIGLIAEIAHHIN